MEKIRAIAPQLLEGDEGWQIKDTYAEALAEFEKYENRVIDKWQGRITTQLTEKLKQPVLVCLNSFLSVFIFHCDEVISNASHQSSVLEVSYEEPPWEVKSLKCQLFV